MEGFAVLVLWFLAMFGVLVVGTLCAMSAEARPEGGTIWILTTALLGLSLIVPLATVTLWGTLVLFLVTAFGHDSPYTTDLEHLEWAMVPLSILLAASVVAAGAAWLWRRRRDRHASFPIALALVALNWVLWSRLGR